MKDRPCTRTLFPTVPSPSFLKGDVLSPLDQIRQIYTCRYLGIQQELTLLHCAVPHNTRRRVSLTNLTHHCTARRNGGSDKGSHAYRSLLSACARRFLILLEAEILQKKLNLWPLGSLSTVGRDANCVGIWPQNECERTASFRVSSPWRFSSDRHDSNAPCRERVMCLYG